MSSRRSPRPRHWTLTFLLAQALWLPALAPAVPAQDAKPDQKTDQPDRDKERKGDEPKKDPIKVLSSPDLVREPVRWRVYQRDSNNRADIPVVLDPNAEGARITGLSLSGSFPGGFNGGAPAGALYRDGKIIGVPTGGPYQVNLPITVDGVASSVSIGPFFVGDLWVLAGQSNMEGVGNLEDVTPPSDRVALLGMNGKWSRAEEPLHWLVDSPDPVHSGDPATREQRAKEQHQNRKKGAGLGLSFGTVMAVSTNVPVGLIASAHGGTSMAQWDPAKKEKEGKSLYGSMLRQVKLAGGKVRGVLWYQGEAEANPDASKAYPKVMQNFINSVREDFHDPDLPFYLVQIGRYVKAIEPTPWNAVQDAQRRLPDRLPNTAVVASIDLELDDSIHIGTPGQKRLGVRLARIAQRELFGQAGATTPTFERVNRRGDTTLLVKFKNVNRVPSQNGPPAAFSGMIAPPMILASGPNPSVSAGPLGGLQPARHIAGFSIRKADGTEIPLIYDAAVGPSKDTVILRLTGKVPEGASLWYGHGLDPYCNLTDLLDMAVPVFGPIALDEEE